MAIPSKKFHGFGSEKHVAKSPRLGEDYRLIRMFPGLQALEHEEMRGVSVKNRPTPKLVEASDSQKAPLFALNLVKLTILFTTEILTYICRKG